MRYRVALACLAMLHSAIAGAQIIAVKTSPLAEGDQNTFLPSANRGMAGVSIALRDTLLDPFANPAVGARLRHSYAFGTPSFYALSHNGSAGSTLPIGIVKRGSRFFGSAAVAMQVIEPPDRNQSAVFNPVVLEAASSTVLVSGTAAPAKRRNGYLFTGGGRTIGDSTLAVGASVQWSRIGGVDGVDLLYPGSRSVREHGDDIELRVGAMKDWRLRSLEAAVVHTRVATSHDISYLDLFWDPGTRTVIQKSRADHNYDRRHLWGANLKLAQTVGDSTLGWRLGASVTANRTTQPTAPSLGMMTPAGDPGRSDALNAGVGVTRVMGATIAGMDAIYEPITAERQLSAGGVDQYRFANAIVRGGVGREFALVPMGTFLRLQAGAEWHRYHYTLHEASAPATSSVEGWSQWTHTVSASMRASQFEFHYGFRVVSGVERPGFVDSPPVFSVLDSFVPVFPQIQMMPVRVISQQFTFTVRLP